MDETLWILHAAVLGAALLQAATGIGFGVIAGPIILLTMNSGAAVQVTILLSLLIAALLVPTLYKKADKAFLWRILAGSVLGLPLGIAVFLLVSVDTLKLLAGFAVLFMAVSASGLLAGKNTATSRPKDYITGVLSGAMSASLAMPGPVAAARMSALAHGKDTIRATVLVMFIFSYSAAYGFQALFVGVSEEATLLTVTLLPATLIGVVLGRLAAARISETVFRRLIVVVLIATSISLLVSSAGPLLEML